jgi:hypothetical protein
VALVKNFLVKIGAVAGSVGLALVGTVILSVPAQAASAKFQLCNYGSDYWVSGTFLDRNAITPIVMPGECGNFAARTSEKFSLHVGRFQVNSLEFWTHSDNTYSSGNTKVKTWGSFKSFGSGKYYFR